MPLQWSEIRQNATAFAREWADETSESAQAKTFWDEFFRVFGVSRKRQASFEWPVKLPSGKHGFIDVFWKGRLVAEHKSTGKDLDRAYRQARDYFEGLKDDELPRYVIVSDFARFRLYDLEEDWETPEEFQLADLPSRVELFGFIAGYQTRKYTEQDPVNIKAAEKLAKLHDRLAEVGYDGHQLEVYLVRLLLCLFADDTGIFMPSGAFEDYIREETFDDGRNVARALNELFDVLDTPEESRLKTLSQQLSGFPYINGALFSENLRTASFDRSMRDVLIECCELDWGKISPAIFGSLFQGIMDQELRRNLGAHYTSEKNILKVIEPLFLDDLRTELDAAGKNKRNLEAFHDKLASLNFFDPACGCGNFLVITYREIRLLELEVLKRMHAGEQQQLTLDVAMSMIRVNVDQFHGIEIEEWPAQIARVAMWLMDHQMNVLVGETFGNAIVRIPLLRSANIVHGNALQLDWEEVVPSAACSFVFGNPPFAGKQYQTPEQKADLAQAYGDAKGVKELDFVAAWYAKAAKYIADETTCAFVSTNSIAQGEQAGLLWSYLKPYGLHIQFAHRTFRWTSEARGAAAVHCVIIGFGKQPARSPVIFDYSDPSGEPQETRAKVINPYLVDAPAVSLKSRRAPICDVPAIIFGSMPNDGGNLLLSTDEKDKLLAAEPAAAQWMRPFMGARELLQGQERWCLWLEDLPPGALKNLPLVRGRVEAVRAYRMGSKRQATRRLADTPTLFGERRQPSNQYIMVPSVSSERRAFIPMALQSPTVIASNLCLVIPAAELYHLGVLSSTMHMAWVRAVAGRMKSDYRYTNEVVYNNYPWPAVASDKRRQAIYSAAQGVLDARDAHPSATLAELYDGLSMPANLVAAHGTLDRAVDAAYRDCGGKRSWSSDGDRVAFLFELYEKLAD